MLNHEAEKRVCDGLGSRGLSKKGQKCLIMKRKSEAAKKKGDLRSRI
jgi:hypothetical protein